MDELKLPNGIKMFHLHRGECAFLYDEVFKRTCYERHGISLRPDATGCVFDVGANIGMAALFFHTRSPGITVHAFEPSPKTFQVLEANVKRLGINAKLHPTALSSAPGTATFTYYPNKSTMSGLFADPEADKRTTAAYMMNEGISAEDASYLVGSAFAAETVTCDVKTASQIIDECGVERIDLLKIDVEKAELDVLLGILPQHWERIHQVAVEVHDFEDRVRKIKTMLEQARYEVVVDQDPTLKGTEIYDIYASRSHA